MNFLRVWIWRRLPTPCKFFVDLLNKDSIIANDYLLQEIHEIAGEKGIETGYQLLQENYHNELSVMQIANDFKDFEKLWYERAYSDVIRYMTLIKAKNHYFKHTK